MFVKICGLREATDVAAAVEEGVSAVGFVLTASPRQISPERARDLMRGVPEDVLGVAVFRGESLTEIRDMAGAAGVTAVQLHEPYSDEAFKILRDLPVQTIRAAVHSSDIDLCCGSKGEDLLLVDSAEAGSGKAWSWDELGRNRPSGKWILAGGLHAENIAHAIESTSPWGVDVSSGVEVRRGVKDPARIREFIRTVRGVEVSIKST